MVLYCSGTFRQMADSVRNIDVDLGGMAWLTKEYYDKDKC